MLHLDPRWYGGRTFTIEAPRLPHADLVKGGRLVLQTGAEPNRGLWTPLR